MRDYRPIAQVLNAAGRPLAPHEFERVTMIYGDGYEDRVDGRRYINQTEQTIARRMREMASLGILESRRREGKQFKEFAKGPKFDSVFA